MKVEATELRCVKKVEDRMTENIFILCLWIENMFPAYALHANLIITDLKEALDRHLRILISFSTYLENPVEVKLSFTLLRLAMFWPVHPKFTILFSVFVEKKIIQTTSLSKEAEPDPRHEQERIAETTSLSMAYSVLFHVRQPFH